MKKSIALISAAVLIAAFLSACQSMPEKQKDMEQMIEKARTS